MRDMLGNTLNKGDLVAFGARSGNSGELRMGIITNIEKAQLLTGKGYHCSWDYKTEKEVDEYSFYINYTVGTGVDESRLLKLEPTSYQEVYDQLAEKAKKYLK